MTFHYTPDTETHGPHNAEHELRKAYLSAIELGTLFPDPKTKPMTGVNPNEVFIIYQRAFQKYRNGNRLAAERWARTTKHLARAFWHEAKILYLEPRTTKLPYLEGAQKNDYGLHEHSDSTMDLLESVANHVPPGLNEMPEDMKRYASRARKHLETLESPQYKHELLRVERIEAAYEYARVLECMALAYEADTEKTSAA